MKVLFQNKLGRVYETRKIDFIQRDILEFQDNESVVKIVSSAICGSDIHIFNNKHPLVPLPITIGHELSGIICAVGKNVKKVKIGDKVTVEPCITCGHCQPCLRGDYGYCENITFSYRKGDGAMANYITVKENNLFVLPDYLDFDSGALIEPLSVATHGVRRADIKLGDKVLIIGAGAIGILTAALCRLSGATDILISDFSQKKLDVAERLGASRTINLSKKENVEEIVREVSKGAGMDKTFECVGRQSSFEQAINLLKKNGLATIIGIFEEPNINFNVMRLITHEIKLQGSQGYCWDFPIAIESAKRIDLKKLITGIFPLDDLQKALETAVDPNSESIKILLKPN